MNDSRQEISRSPNELTEVGNYYPARLIALSATSVVVHCRYFLPGEP